MTPYYDDWDEYCEFMQDEIDAEINGSLELFEDYQLPPQSWRHP